MKAGVEKKSCYADHEPAKVAEEVGFVMIRLVLGAYYQKGEDNNGRADSLVNDSEVPIRLPGQ
jgi:hypothetical protein